MAVNLKNEMVRHWLWQRLNFIAGFALLIGALLLWYYSSTGQFLFSTCFAIGLLLLIEHYRVEIKVVILDYYINNKVLFRLLSSLSNLGFWILSLAVFVGYFFAISPFPLS